MSIFFSVFILSALISYSTIPFIIKFCKAKKIFDRIDLRKRDYSPSIRFGGLSIFLGFFVSCFPIMWILNSKLDFDSFIPLNILLITSFLTYLIGFLDDLSQKSPFLRLIGQILVASFLWVNFFKIQIIELPFSFLGSNEIFIPIFLSYLITIFWLVGLTNAVNWLDGLDGLAGSFSLISLFTISLIFISNGNQSFSIFSLSLTGAIVGFLQHNLYPSKIIMGDGGSNLMGFSLGFLSIFAFMPYEFNNNDLIRINILAFILLLYPILDMLIVMLKRFFSKKSFFLPDRSHSHFVLIDKGLNTPQTVLLITLFTEFCAIFSLLLMDFVFIKNIIFGFFIYDCLLITKSRKFLFNNNTENK